MKVKFKIPNDNKRHRFCQSCYSENVRGVKIDGKTNYKCDNCNNAYDRLFDFDPSIKWWVDEKTKEYWHESVGIFLVNKNKEILLFERKIYPYGHTIPAGHLGANEAPEKATIRELKEETGINLYNVKLFLRDTLADKCRKGADYHKWNLYVGFIKGRPKLSVQKSEGRKPVWLSLEKAKKRKLTPPTEHFLKTHGEKIINFAIK